MDTIHSQYGAQPDSRESPALGRQSQGSPTSSGKQTPSSDGKSDDAQKTTDEPAPVRKTAGLSPRRSTSESSGEQSPSIATKSRFTCTKVEEPKIIFPSHHGEYMFRRLFMRKH
ncbi:unnamed protein product [Strongylus vulgaris]|uniref:Uncharacterized protein n=1 Tax=Strongylus vulgaris TaxID=40348 RepID=A0A3P7IFW9_STRVU|nr:unnamed protein product [Strongylus vulgaris]